jgi:SET domain-containing protein
MLCSRCHLLCGNIKDKIITNNQYNYRLVIGNSNIHGWGLFTLDDIPENTFIREYTGEFLSDEEEISRRGRQNVIARTTYMFSLADPTTIDSMYMGNKTRFCNHSTIYDNILVKVSKNILNYYNIRY